MSLYHNAYAITHADKAFFKRLEIRPEILMQGVALTLPLMKVNRAGKATSTYNHAFSFTGHL